MNRHRQLALGLGVLMAHAGLYLGLTSLLRQPSGRSPESAAASLTWVQLPPAAPSPPARDAAPPRRASRQPACVSPLPRPRVQAFDAIRADAVPDPVQADPPLLAEGPSAAPAPPAAASQAALAPLNLALPRRQPGAPPTAAALAAQDQGLQPRPSRDERLAQALGTDTRLQETQRGVVRRFQQGRSCVDVEPAREAGLNPFNQSVSAVPRQVRPC